MPARIIDDPMSLPDRMARVWVVPVVTDTNRSDRLYRDLKLGFTYALSNRLELVDLMSLRYTFLDDAPRSTASAPTPDKVSLALRGGLRGWGFSSIEGWLIDPVLELQARRRLTPDFYVFAAAGAIGRLSQRLDSHVYPSGRVGTALQVTQRSTWLVAGTVSSVLRRRAETWRWTSAAVALSTGWHVRPLHWLTVGVSVGAGRRVRRTVSEALPAPDMPVPITLPPILWLEASLSTTFFW